MYLPYAKWSKSNPRGLFFSSMTPKSTFESQLATAASLHRDALHVMSSKDARGLYPIRISLSWTYRRIYTRLGR